MSRESVQSYMRDDAVRMLLCCGDKTLARRGVKEEISIAESLTGKLEIPNFVSLFKHLSDSASFFDCFAEPETAPAITG